MMIKIYQFLIFSEGTGVGGSVVKPTVKIKCKFCPRTFNGNIWYFLICFLLGIYSIKISFVFSCRLLSQCRWKVENLEIKSQPKITLFALLKLKNVKSCVRFLGITSTPILPTSIWSWTDGYFALNAKLTFPAKSHSRGIR